MITRIYCDSSTTEACVVVVEQKPLLFPYDKAVTVNQGEYEAVLYALDWARCNCKDSEFEILTDSQLIINQVNGVYKCRNKKLLPLRNRVIAQLLQHGGKLSWIPREENLAGLVLDGKLLPTEDARHFFPSIKLPYEL